MAIGREVLSEIVPFGKDTTGGVVVLSSPVAMLVWHDYLIVATPYGVAGTYAFVSDIFA